MGLWRWDGPSTFIYSFYLIFFSLLLVRYLSGSRRSANNWCYQRVDCLPLLSLLLFISFKHCHWDNSGSEPTVRDVPSKVSLSFISLACKQKACSQAIISYDFSSTVLSNYICYIFCFNLTLGDLPSGRRTGWPENTDPQSMGPPTDLVHGHPYGPVHGLPLGPPFMHPPPPP